MKKIALYIFYSITAVSALIALYVLITGQEVADSKTLALMIIFIAISAISVRFLNQKNDTFY